MTNVRQIVHGWVMSRTFKAMETSGFESTIPNSNSNFEFGLAEVQITVDFAYDVFEVLYDD